MPSLDEIVRLREWVEGEIKRLNLMLIIVDDWLHDEEIGDVLDADKAGGRHIKAQKTDSPDTEHR